jgi:hypothetical protein
MENKVNKHNIDELIKIYKSKVKDYPTMARMSKEQNEIDHMSTAELCVIAQQNTTRGEFARLTLDLRYYRYLLEYKTQNDK